MIRRMNDITYAIDAFLGSADLSPESVRTYRDVLWGFADTVDQLEVGQIERHHCRAYLGRWETASPSTLALYTTVLNRFFAFFVTEEIVDRSPHGRNRPAEIETPRGSRRCHGDGFRRAATDRRLRDLARISLRRGRLLPRRPTASRVKAPQTRP
jgi:hypothetical protein